LNRAVTVGVGFVRNKGIDGHRGGKPLNVFLKRNMSRRGDASCSMVVDAIPHGVKRVADHDAAEGFLPKLPTELVGHIGKDSAPEDTELGLRRE
jgi:hypothetical protein